MNIFYTNSGPNTYKAFNESFSRAMPDTAGFKEKSDDEKLTYLSELMYSSEEGAKEEFGTLLKLLPVHLVFGTYQRDVDALQHVLLSSFVLQMCYRCATHCPVQKSKFYQIKLDRCICKAFQ